jgi:hypothetical protein
MRSWSTGADGEVIVGRSLDRLESKGVVTLHDRRVPGSRANIDHISVGPSGIFLVETKCYRGARVATSGIRSRKRLIVGRKESTKFVSTLLRQKSLIERQVLGVPSYLY